MSELQKLQGKVAFYSLWLSLLAAALIALTGYVAVQLGIPKALLLWLAMVLIVYLGFLIVMLVRRINDALDKIEKL